jgi:hypothetical protein
MYNTEPFEENPFMWFERRGGTTPIIAFMPMNIDSKGMILITRTGTRYEVTYD